MMTKLAILKSELLRDMEKVERLFERFDSSYDRFTRQKEYAYLVESAFYLNQLYTGFERMFENVAAAFENTVNEEYWHKSLLDRMAIGIENIRPTFISEKSHRYLNELRAFRHFFRHTYGLELEDEKFSIVASRARELKNTFKPDIEKFISFIDELLKRK